MPPEIKTLAEKLYWSYANLAMADAALKKGHTSFGRLAYMIRAKLFKGLCSGSMNLGSLVDDDRLKMVLPRGCCYCGSNDALSVDHLFSRDVGGAESADNIVWACRTCNSSKGAKDMVEWMKSRGWEYPPIYLLRRYLKLAIVFVQSNDLGDLSIDEAESAGLPFSVASLPRHPPDPPRLTYWVISLD